MVPANSLDRWVCSLEPIAQHFRLHRWRGWGASRWIWRNMNAELRLVRKWYLNHSRVRLLEGDSQVTSSILLWWVPFQEYTASRSS